MALKFNVNYTPNDGSYAMYEWMKFMTDATNGPGWSITASSDGYGPPLAGNTWTNPTTQTRTYLSTNNISSADVLKGFKAWFVIRAPGGNPTDGYKEICVQQLSKTYTATQDPASWGQFRVKFSPSGFDSDGSQFKVPSGKTPTQRGVNTVVTHSKKDEIIWGGGDDNSPTPVDVFGQGSFRMHMVANNSDGYGFYFFATTIGTNDVRTFVMLDPMLAGSYPASPPQDDKQPYVWFGRMSGSSSVLSSSVLRLDDMNHSGIQNSPGLYYQGSFFNYKNNYETFAGVGVATPCLKNYWNGYKESLANRIPSNPHNGKDDLFPVMYVKPDPALWGNNTQGIGTYSADGWPNLAFGYKGISSLMKIVSTARNTLDTLSVTSTGDMIVVNDMCLPWKPNTTPQI